MNMIFRPRPVCRLNSYSPAASSGASGVAMGSSGSACGNVAMVSVIDGSAVAALASYSASVTVRAQAIGNVPAGDGWWVEVRITGPGGAEVVLAGWRARLSG